MVGDNPSGLEWLLRRRSGQAVLGRIVGLALVLVLLDQAKRTLHKQYFFDTKNYSLLINGNDII